VAELSTTKESLARHILQATVKTLVELCGEACEHLKKGSATSRRRIGLHKRILKLGISDTSFTEHLDNTLLEVREGRADVVQQNVVEGLCKILSTATAREGRVAGMCFEETLLSSEGLFNRLVALDITLTAANYTDVAELERDGIASENIVGIGTTVHQIELGDNTDGALAAGIYVTSKLDGIACGKIDVTGSNGEDDSVGLSDVLEAHTTDLILDIRGLITDRHTSNTGKIDQSQVDDVLAEHLEVDGHTRNTLVLACELISLVDDLLTDKIEVSEADAGLVEELSVIVDVTAGVDELQNERATCNDAATPRQEFTTDEGLEHAALTGGLRANNDDLRKMKIQFASSTNRRHDIVKLVNDGNQ